MRTEKTISTNRTNIKATTVFVIAVVALLYCPFFNMSMIGIGYIGDSVLQIRIGLDMISTHGLIVDDIYSWHQGLNWVPHEEGWYFLIGLFYKIGGIAGVILLTAILNYSIAGIIFKKNLERGVSPYILMLSAAAARVLSFPNYNARPHLVSQLMIVVFMIVMMESDSIRKKIIVFVLSALIIGWFHGGMIPLLFVLYIVFVFIEIIWRNVKGVWLYLLGLLAGFIGSVLNPIGISTWTYAFLQSRGKEIWQYNIEWEPKTFSILEITLILLVFVGFSVDDRVHNFDKKTITGLCIYCLFIIISCKYCRFMNLTAIAVLLFGAQELQFLFGWVVKNIVRIDIGKLKISDTSNCFLSVLCIAAMLFITVSSWIRFFPTNTVSDISALAAYDEGVIDVLHQKNYERIYNSFNAGTWLAFYDIPVHIDNRTDLYMEEFSGVDHIRGKMNIDNIGDMNSFVTEYDADAVVLDLLPGTTDMWFADQLYESDRYEVVYDNTVTSTYDPQMSCRWIVAECVD